MKTLPGLNMAETVQMKGVVGLARCQKCPACKLVKDTGRLLMPNPPFSHANTASVETWNRVLFNNPCATWK